MAWFIITLYLFCLALLGLWGLHRLALLSWLRHPEPHTLPNTNVQQTVLVQLPVFNEAEVVARLIDAAAALNWPSLRIQVLDDSTDHTTAIAAGRVEYWVDRGVNIRHIRRSNRTGYKAGALAYGLTLDDAEFIAIFDADFVPKPHFLNRVMSGFFAPSIGMVQARWGHLNRNQAWLTRIQSLLLDGHFIIEHTARYRTGRFFNFNGTAGVWRRTAIEAAGGWSHDTVTEDLDLSYRAQLAGWRFVYRDQVVAPAEVPATMHAFLSQQHRWAKGTAQTARKLLRPIASAPLTLAVRIEAITHLTMVLAYPAVLTLAILLPLSIGARSGVSSPLLIWMDLCAVIATTFSIVWFYSAALKRGGHALWKCWWEIPLAMAIGVGVSASQTLAVLNGLFSDDATFVRTPKQGHAKAPVSVPSGSPFRTLFTGAMALYYAAATVWVVASGHWASLPLVLLFGAGFTLSFGCLWLEGFRTEEVAERDVPQAAK